MSCFAWKVAHWKEAFVLEKERKVLVQGSHCVPCGLHVDSHQRDQSLAYGDGNRSTSCWQSAHLSGDQNASADIAPNVPFKGDVCLFLDNTPLTLSLVFLFCGSLDFLKKFSLTFPKLDLFISSIFECVCVKDSTYIPFKSHIEEKIQFSVFEPASLLPARTWLKYREKHFYLDFKEF